MESVSSSSLLPFLELVQHGQVRLKKYLYSNFEVAHKLEGIMSYQTATQNEETSPKNQFTARYLRKDVDSNTKSAMKIE